MKSKGPLRSRSKGFADKNKPMEEAGLRYAALTLLYLVFMLAVFAGWTHLPGSNLAPLWALPFIFVISFRQSLFMPAWLLFVAGLLCDIVVGTPLGAHAFAFLGVAIATRLQQRYLSMQGFLAIWADFAALSIVAVLLITLTTIIVNGTGAALGSIAMASGTSWAVLVMAFPLLSIVAHALVNFAQRAER